MPIFVLSDRLAFPPAHFASPEGLIAIGGDLTIERLLLAYKEGIFPWYSEDEPILWWNPDPRLVLFPSKIKISKSLKRTIRKAKFKITMDQAFDAVIRACARTRIDKDEGTWITEEMVNAYCHLHNQGFAHSVEAWHEERLVGGLYGVSLGRCFFGESMFSTMTDASKVAFAKLVDYLDQLSFELIDCQVKTDHLMRFGAEEVSRTAFLSVLANALTYPTIKGHWSFKGLDGFKK